MLTGTTASPLPFAHSKTRRRGGIGGPADAATIRRLGEGGHRVGGAVLERLVGVAHAARHVDGLGGIERAGEDLPEARAGAQIHPRAEDRAGGHGDELVPGLGVDAARDAPVVVVGDVVLDNAKVRDAQLGHLGALPVLLEPAARVAVDGEVDDLEALDAGLGD